jgi:nicotinate-nucleotide pyrophosphorylase (carboxylating)
MVDANKMNQVGEKRTERSIEHEALIDKALELAINEDLGDKGIDLTTDSIVDKKTEASGAVYCKQAGVVAGLTVFSKVMQRFDQRIQVVAEIAEATHVSSVPQKIAKVSGPAHSILKGERLALNLLQRISGIATTTSQFAAKAGPLGIQILDTRKTTPCLRAFERYAVAIAGGTNHRFGLYDAILIKDNHVKLASGIKPAILRARQSYPERPIEIETTNLTEVREALECGVERILLDNMDPQMIVEAVELIAGRAYVEVSGGVNAANIERFLIPGVNGISIGALTHSAQSLDISLEVETFV